MAIFEILDYETREEWLKLRGKGIGGSDASSILHKNPYKSALTLYQEKKGLIIPEDISDKPYVIYGNEAEAPLRNLFSYDYKNNLLVSYKQSLLVRKDKPYMRASLDGFLFCKEDLDFYSYFKKRNATDKLPEPIKIEKGMMGILEIKTTHFLNSMAKEKWDNRIPDNYYVQVLHYLNVTGFDFVILRVKISWDFNGVNTHEIRDYGFLKKDVLADLAYEEKCVDDFWNNYYLKDIEPPLTISI